MNMKADDKIAELLFRAVENGDRQIIADITDRGVSVNLQDSLGHTPLFEAVSLGNYDVARFLIGRMADVNIPEINGITPLMEAASGGDVRMVELLIASGSDTDATDDFGDSAYDYAVNQDFQELGEMLFAEMNVRDKVAA